MVFRTIGICYYFYVFLRFLRFFQNPKSRDFLRFFAAFRTFSQTMISATINSIKSIFATLQQTCTMQAIERYQFQ